MTPETNRPPVLTNEGTRPIERDRQATPPADIVDDGTDVAEFLAGLKRRREAAGRLAPLACGHRDPIDCRRAS